MKGYEILGFLGILRECIKVISKNGKLIATITTISILLNSLLLFTKSSSTRPAISDLLTKETLLSLSNSNITNIFDSFEHIKKDVQIIVGFEFLYLLPSLAISLFSMVTMILASVIAYSDRNLSCADFLSRIPKLCFRTLVTSFHLTLLATGYLGLFFILLISLVILINHPLVLIPIIITLGFLAFIFYMYLAVVWDMASVISVIEKSCYGIQAIAKAEGLVKGKRLHGFTLTLLCTIVMAIISQSFKFLRSAMKGYEILGFLGILRECIKVISKNGKLIATITTISILLNSLLLLAKSSSTRPAISYLFTQETLRCLSNPNTTNFTFKRITEDVQIIIGFEFLYLLPSLAISLFSFATVVLASVVAYSDRNLSFADFLWRIPKLCFRTLVTSFHLTLLGTGSFGLFLILLISLVILCIDHPLVLMPMIIIALGFFTFIFYMYLAVVWDMASVISVIEKSCYGLEAFGKAEGLVKGKRLHGFTLSLLRTIVMVTFHTSFKAFGKAEGLVKGKRLHGFTLRLLRIIVLEIFNMSFKCKETHGEEVELEESLEYSKIPEKEAGRGQGNGGVVIVVVVVMERGWWWWWSVSGGGGVVVVQWWRCGGGGGEWWQWSGGCAMVATSVAWWWWWWSGGCAMVAMVSGGGGVVVVQWWRWGGGGGLEWWWW
ncbi:hypothetical protein RHGRI_000102 [Rhododendron griersonianum]|uniref:Uncharacterized protein n=1 Tax=Rhododendron griersonianum TaxID=479676 RepID=A0AAV6LGE2_9ERIC|nr:hypothetical protein RHGRI_000102 [Rhododendron griersonianum]